jgi:hypothetical protein
MHKRILLLQQFSFTMAEGKGRDEEAAREMFPRSHFGRPTLARLLAYLFS